MNVQEAIEAPRIRIYRDRLLDAEARIPEATRAGARPRAGTRSTCSTTGRGWWAAGRASRATRVRRAHGRRRPAPRRLRAGDLSGGQRPRVRSNRSRRGGPSERRGGVGETYARRVREATTRQSSQGSIGLRMWAWKPAGSVRSGPCSAPCAVMATTGRLPPWSRRQLAERADEPVAVVHRHRQIAHDDVGQQLSETVQPLPRVARHDDQRAAVAEHGPHEVACLGIIVDDQDV